MYWYIITVLFSVLCCCLFQKLVNNAVEIGNINHISTSFKDNLLYILGGIPKVNEAKERDLQVPYRWLTIQFITCACTFLTPFYYGSLKDLEELMKSGTRIKYIIRQMCITLLQVCLVYICVIVGICGYSIVVGCDFNEVHKEIFKQLLGVNLIGDMQMSILCIPILYSVTMALLQMCLNMYIGRILSLAAIVAYDVFATIVNSPFALGNISILFRNKMIVSDGFDVTVGIYLCILVAVVTVVINLIRFNKYNVL